VRGWAHTTYAYKRFQHQVPAQSSAGTEQGFTSSAPVHMWQQVLVPMRHCYSVLALALCLCLLPHVHRTCSFSWQRRQIVMTLAHALLCAFCLG
jgi:uncharacterized protein (DUF2062 family)